MIDSFKNAVIVISSVCMMACTSLQSIPITKDVPQKERPALAAKEQITVVLASGEQVSMQVIESDVEFLNGIAKPSGETRRIAWSDIVRIDQEKPDALKTTLLVAGVLVLWVVVAVRAAGNSLANTFNR